MTLKFNVSPVDLRRVVEVSALAKSTTAMIEVVEIEILGSKMCKVYQKGDMTAVFHDFNIGSLEVENDEQAKFKVFSTEIFRVLLRNFRSDSKVEGEVTENELILKGSRDMIKTKLSADEVRKPDFSGFRDLFGVGVELPVLTKKNIQVRRLYKVDSGYIKDIEFEGEDFEFIVGENEIKVNFSTNLSSITKEIPISEYRTDGTDIGGNRFRIPTSVFEPVINAVGGYVWLGFLGYENGRPLPVILSQREAKNDFKLTYLVGVKL